MNSERLRIGVLLFAALIVSLSVHEAAHAFSAYLLGDDTAKRQGRLTLNPLAHLDQLGTIMIAMMAFYGMGIGWAKPVPVDPLRLRPQRWAMGLVSLAGPFSNWIQACLAYWVMTFVPSTPGAGWDLLYAFCHAMVQVNVSLAAFNLLPFYPLDGQKVLSTLLPMRWSRHFDFYCVRLGAWPLLLVIGWEWMFPFPGPLSWVLGPVANGLASWVEKTAFWMS
ncbi:MAG TPA: site-2 protease family protein [Fibrobacteraceae bacterium]|nr:site-2 protease family protein [Fibrobacteraceae bacterium]